MSDEGKAALSRMAEMIEVAEAAGISWAINECVRSTEFRGHDKVQPPGRLAGTLRHHVELVVGLPAAHTDKPALAMTCPAGYFRSQWDEATQKTE